MAIALSKEKIQALTGLHLIYSFLTLFAVNFVVLHLVNMLFPTHVVLGTYSISHWWAMCHSVLRLTLIGTAVIPLVSYYEWKQKTTFSSKQWMLTYFAVNFLAIWAITRFAQNLGFGVSSLWVVLLLAIVFDWAQGVSMMALGKRLK